MKIIKDKRCIIGECPIWNEFEKRLYFTNGLGNEICMLDVNEGELEVRSVNVGVAAMAFTKENRLIVSREDGVFILNEDDTTEELYDTAEIKIRLANDMKVGPDGRIYVGTQSGKRSGISDEIDGKLYRIDKDGKICVLLDNLSLSNGLEWSIDEKYFYHTDSDTNIIKEYLYDMTSGKIDFTGRMTQVKGVDGFTVDTDNNIFAACWGQGHIAVVDADEFKIKSYIDVPLEIPASCGFAGENMNILAITTASYGADISADKNAGYTILMKTGIKGRKPYLFG